MSISTDLCVTSWEKLDEAVIPEHDLSSPGSSGPGLSSDSGTSCQGMHGRKGLASQGVETLWFYQQVLRALSVPAIVRNAEDAKRKLWGQTWGDKTPKLAISKEHRLH